MPHRPFRLLSVFAFAFVFCLLLSLPFGYHAHGKDNKEKIEKTYRHAEYQFSQQKSYKKSFQLYKKIAVKGHVKSQYEVGSLLEGRRWNWDTKSYLPHGDLRQDPKKAAEWYRKAAEKGHVEATLALGRMYGEGSGVDVDSEQALKMFLEMAEQGHFTAQYQLGETYYLGKFGVGKNYAKAAEWYRKALEKRDDPTGVAYGPRATILHLLGEIYTTGGYGVKQDCAQAVSWYDKMREPNNHLRAVAEKERLGDDYLSGDKPCLKKDYKKAIEFYLSATGSYGKNASIKKLIDIYRKGEIVKKNSSVLYALYLLKGNVEGKLLAEELRKEMTKEQIDEGVRLWTRFRKGGW